MERWPILLLGHKTPLSSWLKCVVCAVEIHIWAVWNPNVRAFKTSLAVRSLSWQFPRPAHRVDKRVVEAQRAWLKHSVTRVSCSSWIMERLWFVGKHVFLVSGLVMKWSKESQRFRSKHSQSFTNPWNWLLWSCSFANLHETAKSHRAGICSACKAIWPTKIGIEQE